MKYGPNGERAAENSFKSLSSLYPSYYIAFLPRLLSCNYVSHLSNSTLRLMQMYHGAGTGNTHSQMCMVSCGLDKFVNTPSKFNDFDITMSNWVERNVPEIYPCLPLSVQIRPEGFLFT